MNSTHTTAFFLLSVIYCCVGDLGKYRIRRLYTVELCGIVSNMMSFVRVSSILQPFHAIQNHVHTAPTRQLLLHFALTTTDVP